METDNSHVELKELIEENTAVVKENNRLLRKIYRNEILAFWARVLWLILLIGLPFALYFYVLEPYFTALGSSYETFSAGMQEIPGWKQFTESLKAIQSEGQ